MHEPHDPNQTADFPQPSSDVLEAGLAAAFGPPRSSLGDLRPVLLKEAKGDSADIIKPNSDAMPPPEQTGDRYQLQGEIARGGMGAVLRGRDVDIGRDLAIKVLLEKYVNRPDVARRFVEEAQIGGQLQHPGVVPVYDIGRFGNRPFFTMKLVKGQTLAALLAEHADAPADRPRFLGVMLQVAQAIAYAHAKGVIHRDLKPANIMVGAFGEVQVMDWGLAKVLTEGGVADEERTAGREHQRPEDVTTIRTARSTGSFGTDTEAGSLLGTPAYMPPEQANGDIANLDRRADVFGLGAILCEILTGNAPYVGRSAEEVRRKACNADLADAMSRLDGCGADVELISLTKSCLAAEAIDRPKEAQAVAEALQNYLDGVQERLHQAELAEAEAKAKAAEEAKRRRLTLALAATVLVAVTLAGGGWLWIKNKRDARQVQVAREVTDALNKATALREQAKAAIVGSAALFAQAREQASRALALVENGLSGHPLDLTWGCSDAALTAQVRRLEAELNEEDKDCKLIAALDEARLAQAATVAKESRFAEERAVPKFREAFAAYGLPAGEIEPAAAAARIRQRPAAMREAIVAVLDEWEVLASIAKLRIDEPHREWLRAVLEAVEPEDAWTRRVRATDQQPDVAKRLAALQELAESAKIAEYPPRALSRLARRLPPPLAAELLRRAQLQYPSDFWVNQELGQMLEKLTPPDFSAAVRYRTAAVALRPDSPGAHLNLGHALEGKGQLDEAIACCRKALELEPKYATAHDMLGTALSDKGELDAAIASYRKAIEVDPKCAAAYSNLGTTLDTKGELDEAIACFRKAIELDPKLAAPHDNMGTAMISKGRLDEAVEWYRMAIELEPRNWWTYTNLGTLLNNKGQSDEAIAWHHKAIELDPRAALAHNNLGVALKDKGQVDEAIACYRKAIALNPKDGRPHSNLGVALMAKGQVDEAIDSYRRSLALNPKDVKCYSNLGAAFDQKGQADESIACQRKALEIDSKYVPAHYNLGLAMEAKGQVDEAIAFYRRVMELDPKFVNVYGALGHALIAKGKYADARDITARSLDLLPEKHYLRARTIQQLQECERLLKLEERLPRLLRGDDKAKSAEEGLAIAVMCVSKREYAAAARFSAEAFAADPKLADHPTAEHRYNAACAASLAAAGQSEDAEKSDDKERSRLRRQAVDWLRADLTLRTKQLAGGQPGDRAQVQRYMNHWQRDRDLADIRDAESLAKLPPEERAACETLWADVAALIKKAEAPVKEHK